MNKTTQHNCNASMFLRFHGNNGTRDLGGYAAEDGKAVLCGKIYRSGELSRIDASARKAIRDKCGVRTIIDLRAPGEVSRRPIPKISGVCYENIPVLKESTLGLTADDLSIKDKIITLVDKGWTDRLFMQKVYLQIVSDSYSMNAYRSLFEILLAQKEGAVMFFCSQGRDRTGIAAMLILTALGVSQKTIIDDYLITAPTLNRQKKLIHALKSFHIIGSNYSHFAEGLVSPSAERIVDALRWINVRYGSVDEYLLHGIGLSEKQISDLKLKYLSQTYSANRPNTKK